MSTPNVVPQEIVQFLRTEVSQKLPTGRSVGEPYVNMSDNQLGFIDVNGAPINLLAITIFSTKAKYLKGAYVLKGESIFRAETAITPGIFDITKWLNIIDTKPGSGGSGNANITIGPIPPTSPEVKDLWWSSKDGNMRIYFDDGDSLQWVDTTVVTKGDKGDSITVYESLNPPSAANPGDIWIEG